MEKKKINYKKLIIVLVLFILLFGLILLYSRFIGTSGFKIKEYNVSNTNLPESFDGIKIVHLTDIHYERTISKNKLEKIVEKINQIKPDIVVLTGDLFDKDRTLDNNQKEEILNILKKIDVSINKYAIKGNHDKDKDWNYIINESGFINLNNNYDIVYNKGYEPILIAGMSSNSPASNIQNKINKINKYKDEYSDIKYKILLMHQPDYIQNFNYSEFNLILAGHSHNGQVRLPIIGAIYLPNGAKKYYKEYYKLDSTDLYISSGLGTSSLNLRLFNKPSFNLYRLNKKS